MRARAIDSRDRRGMVLLIVLTILAALALAGALLVSMGTMDIRMSGEFARTTKAFYAAEAGAAKGLDEIAGNPAWAGGTGALAKHTIDENTRPSLVCAVIVIASTHVNVPNHNHPLWNSSPTETSTLPMVGSFAQEYPSYLS